MSRATPADCALTRAERTLAAAAAEGFRWREPEHAWRKVAEEVEEVRETMEPGADAERREDELGDLLIAAVGLARELGVDPVRALDAATRKFERRFDAARRHAGASGFERASAARLVELWREAKLERG
jgi:ATP diphosphatase